MIKLFSRQPAPVDLVVAPVRMSLFRYRLPRSYVLSEVGSPTYVLQSPWPVQHQVFVEHNFPVQLLFTFQALK